MTEESVLEELAHEVLEIKRLPDGKFRFIECCDYHFSLDLTRAQLLQLIEELRALADQQG